MMLKRFFLGERKFFKIFNRTNEILWFIDSLWEVFLGGGGRGHAWRPWQDICSCPCPGFLGYYPDTPCETVCVRRLHSRVNTPESLWTRKGRK